MMKEIVGFLEYKEYSFHFTLSGQANYCGKSLWKRVKKYIYHLALPTMPNQVNGLRGIPGFIFHCFILSSS